ncbi:hypothetical protein QN277_017163 [Acacia crassicarpa]|uniref:GRF-type domain-containing protein n=1 Tax=Acacia crassicarpa TaxID=499986 RepID=A0AAE1MTT7_9FABA|nr:hypothetical protein QN277_017163 [Acacia crassicarpa]
MASSSSSSTARCRRRVVLLRQRSREDDYEPPRRYCYHRMVASRWTSWTEGNPGRRFYECPYYYQDGGCGFFAWHDEEFGERANTVIKELLDDIDKLYDENSVLRRADHGQRVSDELDAIHNELRRLKRTHELYDGELRKGEKKFKVAMSLLFVTCVWLYVLYTKK